MKEQLIKRTSFVMTEEMLKQIEKYCKRNKMKQSDFIREAINSKLNVK